MKCVKDAIHTRENSKPLPLHPQATWLVPTPCFIHKIAYQGWKPKEKPLHKFCDFVHAPVLGQVRGCFGIQIKTFYVTYQFIIFFQILTNLHWRQSVALMSTANDGVDSKTHLEALDPTKPSHFIPLHPYRVNLNVHLEQPRTPPPTPERWTSKELLIQRECF